MKINNFRGDLTDISAKKALLSISSIQVTYSYNGNYIYHVEDAVLL